MVLLGGRYATLLAYSPGTDEELPPLQLVPDSSPSSQVLQGTWVNFTSSSRPYAYLTLTPSVTYRIASYAQFSQYRSVEPLYHRSNHACFVLHRSVK
uniref:Uncharacterized protein n=1 Tax=Picea glauca TaxID=3330 RepID=A0A101LV19_PICGL|nr:hypothetical protein ABT39_MTgene2243 [Picea glauca]